MSGRTVTRSQLSDAIFKEVGLSQSDCGTHLDSVLNMVTDVRQASGEGNRVS